MGHATNIIAGIANGLESTGLPVIIISVAILTSYYLGESSGIVN
jgi:Na+/H+-translocating membrane pyrophosphatase